MTAPNMINTATVTGKTAFANLTTVSANIITNSSNSNTAVKLNHVTLANYSAAVVTGNVIVNRSGVSYYVGGSFTLPANSTLTVLAKDTMTYLEEGDILQSYVSANVSVHLLASYEIVS